MPNVNIYLPAELFSHLRRRGLGSGENIIRRDIERYYALLEHSMQRVSFTPQEWDYLRIALHGTIFDQHIVPYLPRAIADAVKDASFGGLGEKLGVDVYALIEKILNLSHCEALAVIDAIECFWEGQK